MAASVIIIITPPPPPPPQETDSTKTESQACTASGKVAVMVDPSLDDLVTAFREIDRGRD